MPQEPNASPAKSAAAPLHATGVYVLEMNLAQAADLPSGRFAGRPMPPGEYLYVGSGRGPGGVHARLGRHLRPESERRLHWHIDHLRRIAHLRAYAFLEFNGIEPVDIECRWSRALAAAAHSFIPIPQFGASDCRSGCPAHLIGFPKPMDPNLPLLAQPQIRLRLAEAAGIPIDRIQVNSVHMELFDG